MKPSIFQRQRPRRNQEQEEYTSTQQRLDSKPRGNAVLNVEKPKTFLLKSGTVKGVHCLGSYSVQSLVLARATRLKNETEAIEIKREAQITLSLADNTICYLRLHQNILGLVFQPHSRKAISFSTASKKNRKILNQERDYIYSEKFKHQRKKLKIESMLTDLQDQYCENSYITKRNLQSQHNSYQNSAITEIENQS